MSRICFAGFSQRVQINKFASFGKSTKNEATKNR
jgi:hypothetical protein